MNLASFLSASALRYADCAAFICGDITLTFGELEVRANQIAHRLLDSGVGHGDRVALVLPNTLTAIELMCGAARAGAVIVPISSRLSADEVSYILSDATPRMVFGDSSTAPFALQLDTHYLCATDPSFDRWREAGKKTNPQAPYCEDLVLGYTSGTTGHPKGAIGTQSAVITGSGLMTAIEYGFTETDVLLITSPIAHRVGLSRVINTLCSGMTTVVMPRFDATEAVDSIQKHAVTCISVVPTIARLLIPELERRRDEIKSLERMFATGEAFPVPLKERLFEVLPQLQLHTSYAQTEAGVVTNLRPDEQRERPESIGRCLPGVEVKLLDESGNISEDGKPGEVNVRCGRPGTAMTMSGYFNNPRATAEALNDGWLRTGDICQRDEDGYFYFVDRAKDMIVSGGLNVYAKEVELVLVEHPDIADAAVVGRPDEQFGESVVAFVQLQSPECSITQDEVIHFCKKRLASYKKPRQVLFIDEFPRTMSGKVKKHNLKALHLKDISSPA